MTAVNRGFNAAVSTAFERDIAGSTCSYCGQCVSVCPVNALSGRNTQQPVLDALADPDKIVIAQTAPAVRTALGRDFGYEPGTLVTGKMVSALRRLGFDYVFDTDFAADLTIMEEGTELLQRIGKYLKGDQEVKMPLMTSCCPGWVSFVEQHFPELLDNLSTAKSPQQMFGAIAKSYFAEKLGVDRKRIVVVSIMPCLAKKYEASRPEFAVDGNPDVDISIYTRELARLIRYANINFAELPDSDFDRPLGESTGAGVIFGTTGGVIEAACRTAYELYTKKTLPKIDFEELRGLEGIRSATIDFDGTPIKIGIAHGLGNAVDWLKKSKTACRPIMPSKLWHVRAVVSVVAANRSTGAGWRCCANVRRLSIRRIAARRFARAMRILIFKLFMLTIWENRVDRVPTSCCIRTTSTARKPLTCLRKKIRRDKRWIR